MERHILSVLALNHSGVLSKISGLFSRRGYNIDCFSAGVTEDPKLSRMTIVVHTDPITLEQIKNQLEKLIDVIKVVELKENEAVFRELVMIKIEATKENRAEILEIVNIFRAHIVDVGKNSLVVEITGDESKINALIGMLEGYGIKEITRTGLSAIMRGSQELKD